MSSTKIQHLAIIMDGNRRWARAQGLPPLEGHRVGYHKVSEVLGWCQEAGIKTLTLYAFSTENWKRSEEEVKWLMDLIKLLFTKDAKELHQKNVRVKVLGKKEGLNPTLQQAIKEAEELTANNTDFNLNLAINYGGRQELVDAFNKILKNPPAEVTEKIIEENLYSVGQLDPDLIIRTSGELRTSGFLLWQGAYSELYFCQHNWPEFSREDFNEALENFAERQRRFGQ
ncbi:MAG: polyprenyl diphosphate synthase [Candidatus Uhrbacteria bacterium]